MIDSTSPDSVGGEVYGALSDFPLCGTFGFSYAALSDFPMKHFQKFPMKRFQKFSIERSKNAFRRVAKNQAPLISRPGTHV